MLRRSTALAARMPREQGLRPEHSKWRLKNEPWAQMKRMGAIAGTGFYIPPEWYNHFRMFPPVQNQFLEEQTLNPYNAPDQLQKDERERDEMRDALRKEIGMESRGLAAEGMRYYNLFWVEKAMDRAERNYHHYKDERGYSHQEAIRKALEEYYEEQTTKKRALLIQQEESKLSGKFITMREASTMLTALSQFQTLSLAPHQYAELASRTQETVRSEPVKRGRKRKIPRSGGASGAHGDLTSAEAIQAAAAAAVSEAAAKPVEEGTAEATEEATTPPVEEVEEPTADELAFLLDEDSTSRTYIEAQDTVSDSNVKVHEVAKGGVGSTGWYGGQTPSYPSK